MNSREILEAMYRGAIRAADPHALVQERWRKIPEGKRLIVIGAGKASFAMAESMEEFLGERIERGLVVVKDAPKGRLKKIDVAVGGHPVPDERSADAGRRILTMLAHLSSEHVVVVLVSGGASSLIALPKNGTIAEFAALSRYWLASGKTIQEINRERRALLELAGGGLARAAAPASVVAFILSDVIGDDLATIGSGPTVLDPPEPARVNNLVIGNNALALGGAAHAAKRFGLRGELIEAPISGPAREAARAFAEKLETLAPGTALIGGGEATVELSDRHGLGGRCQEAALAASLEINGKDDLAILFAGTDGSDGPTPAAGAFADGSTVSRAIALGRAPGDFLARHDSFRFFEGLGDLFQPGPSGTNVADVWLGIRA